MSGNDVIHMDALQGETDPRMVTYNSFEIILINMFGIAFV
jgi:hypothetical protein